MHTLTAHEIRDRIKNKELSSVEITKAYLDRIEKVEDKVVMLEYMLENTNPQYVFFQLDVYWTVMGKYSPVAMFKKYPQRFTLLHIKDKEELGASGMVGFDAIFNNLDVAGTKHIVVEVERYNFDPKTSVKMSFDYLNNAEFVK